MKNIKLTLQYDGTNYNGWQIQPSGISGYKRKKDIITIQGVIQEAIKKITGEDAKVIAAGRTDAGVHAIEQIASFKTDSKLTPDIIKRALNALLPDDIRVMDACYAEDNFHPRYDAKSKVYFYLIANTHITSPFIYRYAWKIPEHLDTYKMDTALNFFIGRHDFSSFRASGCGAKNPIRTILDISLIMSTNISFIGTNIKGRFLKISVEADAFLRHMVRNIVGTIIEVGRLKIKPEDIPDLILSKDRRVAGPTAPANGLFLEKIKY